MVEDGFAPLDGYLDLTDEEMLARVGEFYDKMRVRRSVRQFSEQPVPLDVVRECLRTAGTAPSGAHMQPWHFVVVGDPEVKRRIREAAEERERDFYGGLAGEEWLGALAPLGTNWSKPFLTEAPYLIVVFAQRYGRSPSGGRIKHYYVHESVGIAAGLLIAAAHQAGLASLPYTPTKPSFLNWVLGRPENERPFLVLAVGRPAPDATVPVQARKPLDEISTLV